MAGPVALRSDYDARALRRLAKASRDADQTRRLLALAAIYDGSSRGDGAEIGGVGLQTVRDWVLRFNAEGPARLGNGKAPGGRPLLGEVERAALRQVVEAGPIPAIHGVVRWRIVDLMQWLWEEFRLSVSKQTMSKELRAMGFRKLSARPRHHAQDDAAAAAFKNVWPPRLQGVSAIRSEQSASTYPVSGRSPGQDGDSRVPVLIKLTATERHFLNQDSETPIDCQAISLHHQQTIESRSRSRRGRPNSRLGRCHDVGPLELTAMPQHGPYNPGQLVRQGHHHDVGMRPCQQATQPRTEGGPAPCQGRHGGSSAMDQQLAKVFVSPLADTEQSRLSSGRCLAWYEP